jgi:hypothetical protein
LIRLFDPLKQFLRDRALRGGRIPPEIEMKALSYNNKGRLSLTGPGRIDEVSLKQFREARLQELVFDLAGALTR